MWRPGNWSSRARLASLRPNSHGSVYPKARTRAGGETLKIELTAEEAAKIILRSVMEHQSIHLDGTFKLEWKIAAATGQPSILVGAVITLEKP